MGPGYEKLIQRELRSVTENRREQGRCLRWWGGRFIRDLSPLTVKARHVWHVYGTAEPIIAVCDPRSQPT
jgi:hypothetical protein